LTSKPTVHLTKDAFSATGPIGSAQPVTQVKGGPLFFAARRTRWFPSPWRSHPAGLSVGLTLCQPSSVSIVLACTWVDEGLPNLSVGCETTVRSENGTVRVTVKPSYVQGPPDGSWFGLMALHDCAPNYDVAFWFPRTWCSSRECNRQAVLGAAIGRSRGRPTVMIVLVLRRGRPRRTTWLHPRCQPANQKLVVDFRSDGHRGYRPAPPGKARGQHEAALFRQLFFLEAEFFFAGPHPLSLRSKSWRWSRRPSP